MAVALAGKDGLCCDRQTALFKHDSSKLSPLSVVDNRTSARIQPVILSRYLSYHVFGLTYITHATLSYQANLPQRKAGVFQHFGLLCLGISP